MTSRKSNQFRLVPGRKTLIIDVAETHAFERACPRCRASRLFEPYAVQCLTCGSQLRVTDPSLIDTIATCPKCGSMVQIEPPASPGQVAVGQPNVDSEAITEDAIAFDEEVSGDTAPSAPFEGEAGPSDHPEAAPATSPLQWQSERTQRSRQIALVVAVSISGLLVAVAVFSWFVQSWQSDQPGEQVAQTQPVTPDPVDEPDDELEQLEPVESVDPEVESVPESPPMAPDADAPSETPVVPEVPAAIQPDIPVDMLPKSPFDEPEEPAADEPKMQELPAGLEAFTEFLLQEGIPEREPDLIAPPTIEEVVEIEAAAEEEEEIVAAKARKLNLRANLGVELALAAKEYALSDLMLLIGQVTTVPIQIDWVSFDLAGMDVDSRVKVPQGWHTVGDLLNKIAGTLGAEIQEQESLIVLTLTDATFGERLNEIADLSDFADSASAIQVLNEFLGGDGDELHLGSTREDKQLAAFAVESLRRMRDAAPKVPDVRLSRWAQATADQPMQWPLAKVANIGEPSEAPISIAQYLRETAKRNSATCIVNWHDLNRRSVSPENLVFPHADDDPNQALKRTLENFDIQVRQVDPQRWWVGTEPTYDLLPVVIWSMKLGDQRENFVRRISNIMSTKPGDPFQIAVDPVSDRALLLLPRYIVRQLPKITESLVSK